MKTSLYQKIIVLAVILVCWGFWTWTMSPDFYWLDSGIYTAAAYEPGIPYPPGFPVFMMPAFIFSFIPVGNIAVRVQLFSMTTGAAALFLLFHLVSTFCMLVFTHSENKQEPAEKSGRAKRTKPEENKRKSVVLQYPNALFAAACGGTAIFGLAVSFWTQAVNTEVYAYQTFFTIGVLYAAFSAWQHLSEDSAAEARRYMKWAAVLLGLSFGNHPMSVGLLLTFILFVVLQAGKYPHLYKNYRNILIITGLFAACALIPYLYLPVLSHLNVDPDWGNPETTGRLFKVMTGIHHTAESSSFDFFGPAFMSRSREAAGLLKMQYFLPGLLAAFIGLMTGIKKKLKANLILIFLALVTFFLATAYIKTKEYAGWYLTGYVSVVIWYAAGLYAVVILLQDIFSKTNNRALRKSVIAIPVIVTLFVLFMQVRNNAFLETRRNNYTPREYGRNMIERLDANSLVFIVGDNPSSAVLALQIAEKFRDDLTVLHQNFLGSEWYRNNIQDRDLVNLPEPPDKPEREWTVPDFAEYVVNIIRTNPERSVYFIKPDKIGLLNRLNLTGAGMLYKLIKSPADAQVNPSCWDFRFAEPLFYEKYPNDPQMIINRAFEEACLGYYRAYLFAIRSLMTQYPEESLESAQKALRVISGLRLKKFYPKEAYAGLWTAAFRTGATDIMENVFDRMTAQRRACLTEMINYKWFDAAFRLIEKLESVRPNDPVALEMKGIACASTGRYDQAKTIFQEMVRRFPGNAVNYYNLGNVYDELGDKEKAVTNYEKALKLNPRFELARRALNN